MPASHLEVCLRLTESQPSVGQGAAIAAKRGVKAELCCESRWTCEQGVPPLLVSSSLGLGRAAQPSGLRPSPSLDQAPDLPGLATACLAGPISLPGSGASLLGPPGLSPKFLQ